MASRVEDIADRDVVLDISDAQIRYTRRSGVFRRSQNNSVVEGVSLQVRSGQAVGLVGESGCGKSTLARAIVGLLPLAAGRVCVDGLSWADATKGQRALMRRRVQMVFQDTYQSLNPRKTIRQTLAEPLTVHELVGRSAVDGRIAELFDLVGLPASLTDRYPYQLSGGQRQRVGLARALAMEPKLIVADEPVSALDVSIQAQIINLLADLKDRLGIAYLFIAHDLSVVRQLCEVVAVMKKGRIVEVGDSDQIFATPRHPYTASLLAVIGGSPLDASEGSPR
jgi:ABC-type glutathione transport system ATPase component